MAFCSKCGKELAENAKFCANCGTPVESGTTKDETKERTQVFVGTIRKCPNCGEQIGTNTTKCPACGFVIEKRNVSASLDDFVKKLAERTGLVIYYINDYALPFCKKCSVMRCIGPEEWVSLFSGAEYVVTNSFHGTAFSINFNKKFFVEMQPEEIGVNSRLENILDKFGLNERIIKNSDSEAWDKTIDYDRVNRILYKEKEKSMAYLENIAGKKE